ncbi:MAG: hypothetical protein ABIB65_02085 [Candidatus Margulisiibacteriota bacterium]
MEILGLLDALESLILDGFKIPLSKKTMINEEEVLAILDKIRLVVQSGGSVAKKAVGKEKIEKPAPAPVETMPEMSVSMTVDRDDRTKAADIIQQAYQMSKQIREGADKYADEVLSNLEATSVRILRTVKAGRERLQGTVQNKEGAKIEQIQQS